MEAEYGDGGALGFGYALHHDDMQFGDAQQPSSQDSLLNRNEAVILDNFFDNPDHSAGASADPFLQHSTFSMDGKINMSAFGNSHGFNHPAGTVDPASTMADHGRAQYRTHSVSQETQRQSPHVGGLFDGSHSQYPTHSADDLTAGYLLQMSHSEGQLHPPDNGSSAGSWGNLGSAGPVHQPGANFHGDAMSNFNHSHNPQLAMLAHLGAVGHAPNAGLPPHMDSNIHLPNGLAHVRTHSLNHDAQAYPFFGQSIDSTTHDSRPQTRPPPLAHFGSDPLFAGNVVPNPAYYNALHQGKEANLMQVPFAQKLARSGNMQAKHMAHQDHRTFHTNNVPTASRNFGSTGSSPGALYSATPKMATPMHEQAASWGRLHDSGRVAQLREEDDDEYDGLQPRKRRKSQVEREDDAEYRPESHAQGTNSKRGPKVPKAEVMSDDEDDFEPYTPTNTASAKRRRSTVNGRAATGSGSSPNSPADAQSPLGGDGSSRRKSSGKPRNNLTEEQKRQNHIISEQKRRNVIKQGYHDLDRLVPVLNGGKSGLSRAEQIKEIVTYVRSVVDGNVAVERMLEEDDGDEGNDGLAGPSVGDEDDYGGHGMIGNGSFRPY